MGKLLMSLCIFVYKTILFILLLPVKILKYFFLGVFFSFYYLFKLLFLAIVYICLIMYRIIKYFLYGIGFVFILIWKLIQLISYIVYKFFRYNICTIIWPFVAIYRLFNRLGEISREKKKDADERRLIRDNEKRQEQYEKQKKREEELLKKNEEKERLKKASSDEYVNENVVIEKKTFKQKFNNVLQGIFGFPSYLVKSIKKSYANSTFVKNAKNKRDISRQALLIEFQTEEEKSPVKIMFEYTAKDEDGKVIKGYFEAYSKVEVHSYLLSEGFEVYSIRTNKWIQLLHGKSGTNKTKIKYKDLIFFLTQLSTYIKAGIPLVDSLKILNRQFKNKAYQRIFSSIISDLTMGENFSDALSKQGEAFPRILINMVKAAEMTGELPEALDDMSEYFTETEQTRKQMITAMMYPAIIFVISVAVVTFILLFVIPQFVQIYESMDATSVPAFTRAVLAVSEFLQSYIIYLFIGLIVAIIIFRYLYKSVKAFRTIVQWLLMHTPVFGNVVIYNEVTMFTKTFSSLLSHNVFITDSMEILNKVTNNEIYKMLILDTITNLAKGEKISAAFKDHWAFPLPAYEMLVTGEKTGQLPEMMGKVSKYYQDLHKNSVTRIKTFVEPILIIFLTAVVGVIVLSIVIPMFGMYQTIQTP